MATATSKGGAWRSLLLFGVLTFTLSAVLAALAVPFVPLPWWKIFRRCVSIASAASLLIVIRGVQRRSIRSYGFAALKEGKRQLCFGLILGCATLLAVWGVGLLIGAHQIHLRYEPIKTLLIAAGMMPAMALVGVLEEMVFRGMILQQLMAYSKPLAVIVSSALYAVVHIRTFAPTWGIWALPLELIGLFLLGSLLSFSYLMTGQLYLAVGLHASLAYGARINKLFLAFPHPELNWLIGTSRLINGVVSWAALLIIGMIIAGWTHSSRQHRRAIL